MNRAENHRLFNLGRETTHIEATNLSTEFLYTLCIKRERIMQSPPPARKITDNSGEGDSSKDGGSKRFEARPQFKQQTFDEIYGIPENFLEIEVRKAFFFFFFWLLLAVELTYFR